MKEILITGGAGFIGSEIVKQLYIQGDWNITVLDSMTKQIHGKNYKDSYLYKTIADKCQFIYGDICDFNIVKSTLKNIEYIIHLAAETGTGQSMYQINQYNQTNIMGTSNLLQAISSMGKESKIKKIILSSSRSVYGEGKYNCTKCGNVYPIGRSQKAMLLGDFNMYCPYCNKKVQFIKTTEDSKIQPNSLYAFTKYAQERMLQTMCPTFGLEYTIFRFQNVYGVGQSLKNPYTGILSIFSALMLENKPINIFEDGLESRDFINVVDVASTVIKALTETKTNSEIINLGSGISTSVIDITKLLKKEYKSKSVINISGDFRLGDIAHNVADIKKAQDLLEFEQTISLEEGLQQFCEWVKEQDRDNSGYEKSLNEMEAVGMFLRK